MKKWRARLAIIVAISVLGVAVTKNLIAKAAVSGGVKAITGLDLHIQQMHVGLLRSVIGIRGLTLENPSGFPDKTMIDLPEIFVNYDLGAFLQRQVHLKEVRLNLKELTVIKNRDGRLNLNALKVVSESQAKPVPPSPSAPPSKSPGLHIDALTLDIGKVIYKDYTAGGSPKIQEFPVNIHERYEHITNPQAFAALVVSRALMNTTVARLTNLDLTALKSQASEELAHATRIVTDVLETAKDVPGGAIHQLQNTATQLTGGVTNVTDSAKDAVKKTGESLKKVIPFGH